MLHAQRGHYFKTQKRQVPVLSVVENMAYFDCNHGERYRPFGPGHARQLVEECGLPQHCVFSLPLSPAVAAGSDSGDAVALSDPAGKEAQVLKGVFVVEVGEVVDIKTWAPRTMQNRFNVN